MYAWQEVAVCHRQACFLQHLSHPTNYHSWDSVSKLFSMKSTGHYFVNLLYLFDKACVEKASSFLNFCPIILERLSPWTSISTWTSSFDDLPWRMKKGYHQIDQHWYCYKDSTGETSERQGGLFPMCIDTIVKLNWTYLLVLFQFHLSIPVIVALICPGVQQWLSGSSKTDLSLQQPQGSSEQSFGCSPSNTGGRDPVYERDSTTATDWVPNIDWEERGHSVISHGGG